MKMLSQENRLQPAAQVLYKRLSGGEAVLLDLTGGQYYTLNATGARIWDLLQEGHAPAGIAASLAEAYDIALEEAMQHVLELLEDLKQEGLLHEQGDTEGNGSNPLS